MSTGVVTRRRVPDSATIKSLARVASVPDEAASRLALQVRLTVEIVWDGTQRKKVLANPRVRASVGDIVRSANALRVALRKRDPGSDELLHIMMRMHQEEDDDTRKRFLSYPHLALRLADVEEVMDVLAAAAEAVRNLLSPKARRKEGRAAHRPLGAVANYPFRLFVHRLLTDVAECGGDHLTIDKNRKTGTLVAALGILRDDLPPSLVDFDKLPYSTLATLRADWTKNRRSVTQNR